MVVRTGKDLMQHPPPGTFHNPLDVVFCTEFGVVRLSFVSENQSELLTTILCAELDETF